jgi:3-deoxy-D-manno-octulosonate 8-phosphate phosphatase (KDO 8-P phosphatase)
MIKLIILDVDGTLTNGKITYDTNGNELKSFDVKDGMGIATWCKRLNYQAAIVTGRKSSIVQKRANELGIRHLYQGVDNKDEIIEQILKKENLTWDNVASIGDDLNDYKMLSKSKLSFAVANAVDDIKSIANIVTSKNGGDGAVREMIEILLKKNNDKKIKELWV